MVDYMDHDFEQYIVAIGLSRGTNGLRHDYCARIDYCTLPDIRGWRISEFCTLLDIER